MKTTPKQGKQAKARKAARIELPLAPADNGSGGSGGSRTTDRRHEQRNSRRRAAGWSHRTFLEAALADPPPDLTASTIEGARKHAFAWIGRGIMRTLAAAASDPGPEPEVQREQLLRGYAFAAKILDPAALSEELRQFHKAITDRTHPTLTALDEETRRGERQVAPFEMGAALERKPSNGSDA